MGTEVWADGRRLHSARCQYLGADKGAARLTFPNFGLQDQPSNRSRQPRIPDVMDGVSMRFGTATSLWARLRHHDR